MRTMTLCLVALALSACAPKGPAPAAMVASADSLDKAFLVAFNKGNAPGVVKLYWNSPELVSIGLDGMGVTGWDATLAGYDTTFKNMPGVQLEFTETHNLPIGETVLGWGRWKAVVGGQTLTGRYSDVKAVRDGKWVYVMDHASVPLPPPAAVPAGAMIVPPK